MTPKAATLVLIVVAESRVLSQLATIRQVRGTPAREKETALGGASVALRYAVYYANVGDWQATRRELGAAHRLAIRSGVRTAATAIRRALDRADGLKL